MFSQEKVTKVEYKVVNTQGSTPKFCYLYFNNNFSLYQFYTSTETKKNNLPKADYTLGVIISKEDSIGRYKYYDFKNNTIYEREVESFFKKGYIITKNKIQNPKWELLDSIITIDSYKCNLAKTNYYGREYYAWYCIDLPFSKGPWKLNGLAGLILYAYTNNNKIFWKAEKITFNIDKKIPNIRNEKYISRKTFLNNREKEIKKQKIVSDMKIDQVLSDMESGIIKSATFRGEKVFKKNDFLELSETPYKK